MHTAVSFIEAHLRQDVTVGAVADAVGYSLYHFSRTFNRMVQHTPYDYLMRRRISVAAEELVASDRLIIDIALDYQFSNPETYTRATRRLFGVTPSDLRAAGTLPFRSRMPPLTESHLVHRNERTIKPEIVTLPARSLLGLQSLTYGDPSVEQALWSLVRRHVEGSPHWAMVRQPPAWASGETDGATDEGTLITAGTVVEGNGEIPAPLVMTRIPGGAYARCAHDGPAVELPLLLDYVYHTWLPKVKRRPAGPWWLVACGDDPATPQAVAIPLA
jgi:AraC family transcriptional regulator